MERGTPMGQDGFSLFELVLVMALIALLAVLVTPGLQSTMSSFQLRSASDLLSGDLDLARQTATTQNQPVEVRLYQDPTLPPDARGNHPYRSVALVIPARATGGADQFLAPPGSFAGDVILDTDPQFTTLLNPAYYPASTLPLATEAATAPLAVQGRTYLAFSFQPDGALNLPATDAQGAPLTWTLTLVNQAAQPGTGTNPARNFATLTLNVVSGRVTVYRP